MNVLKLTGLTKQIGYIKAYVNQKITQIVNSSAVDRAVGDENGNNIANTYVKNTDIGNSANKIPRFNEEGHLVLPNGTEIY